MCWRSELQGLKALGAAVQALLKCLQSPKVENDKKAALCDVLDTLALYSHLRVSLTESQAPATLVALLRSGSTQVRVAVLPVVNTIALHGPEIVPRPSALQAAAACVFDGHASQQSAKGELYSRAMLCVQV